MDRYKSKAQRILEVVKEVPCRKLMLNELVTEINNRLPDSFRMHPRTISFLVSALSRQNKIFLCKEVISCNRYYTIQIKPETTESTIDEIIV